MAVLIGAILIWIAAVSSPFNQPIVWWQTILLVAVAVAVAVFISGVYLRERGNPSS